MFTNKTEHYELPQYIATDKPTYLVDFNGAMQKIDSTMYGAVETAENASTTATSADNKVDGVVERVTALEEKTTTQSNTITTLQNSNSLLTQRVTSTEVKDQQQDVKISTLESSVAQATTDAEDAMTEVSSLNGYLTANEKPFIFDYQSGVYGFNTDPARGADSFVPFSKAVEYSTEKRSVACNNMTSYENRNVSTNIASVGKKCVGIVGYSNSNTNVSPNSLSISDNTLKFLAVNVTGETMNATLSFTILYSKE